MREQNHSSSAFESTNCGFAAVAIALLLVGGCSTQKPAGVVGVGMSPLADNLHFHAGTVALAPDLTPAKVSFDKADGQIGDAADWAGTAAGNMLGTTTSEPLLDLPVGVGTFVLAPAMAVKGAVNARKHVSPDKLAECESKLAAAMREMAPQERFHNLLLKVASEQCHGRLAPLEGARNRDTLLQARIEELRLERAGAGDTSFRLRIKMRTRLVRAADGAVLGERCAEYQSGTCLFLDWTLQNAFQNVAETGYRELAEDCVNRLLAVTDKPVVAGAGNRRVSAQVRPGAAQFTGSHASSGRGATQFVSYPVADTGTLGVYSRADLTHVAIQRPLSRDEASAEAREETTWMLDGLNEHPNMLVALPACAVGTPISLWKQGVALVRGSSPRTIQKADAKLSEAAMQAKPHHELAFQVAQQLAPRTSQPVVLVRGPLLHGAEEDAALVQCVSRGSAVEFAGGQNAAGNLFSRRAETALEIQVQKAVLAGDGEFNSKLALCVEARAAVVRTRDGQQLYSCPVQYRGERRKFTEWAAQDAKLFRAELQKCYHDLGAAMVEQLVSRGAFPAEQQPAPVFAKH